MVAESSNDSYLVSCWNCLGDFDAVGAVWCSCDPKYPTKLCPFCFRCFCAATELYKREFWRRAPERLLDELQTLTGSKDRLGDILIRMKKITTPQLLEVLREQGRTGQKLGELLVGRGLVHQSDIDAALRSKGVNPLVDTHGAAYATSPTWEKSDPGAILQYILSLAARKEASDVLLEAKQEHIAIRFRIDGFAFRVEPVPRKMQAGLERKLFETFSLPIESRDRPQTARTRGRFGDADYDLVLQTLPTEHGLNATVKLIHRERFLKDFVELGLDIEDRVRLVEQLRGGFGLVLVTSPLYNGAVTTWYSIMQFLTQAQKDVLSLEAPIHWQVEGVRQYEVPVGPQGLRMEETLRSMLAVRPDVLMLSSIPDRSTAMLAAQLANSLLVVATQPAVSAAEGVKAFVEMGASPQLVAGSLSLVLCQRLVRKLCRICRHPVDPPPLQTLARHGISPAEAPTLRFFRGKGCPTCNNVGFRGRRASFEIMAGTSEVRNAVAGRAPAPDLEAAAVAGGMTRLRERCLDLVRQGITGFDEFARLRL